MERQRERKRRRYKLRPYRDLHFITPHYPLQHGLAMKYHIGEDDPRTGKRHGRSTPRYHAVPMFLIPDQLVHMQRSGELILQDVRKLWHTPLLKNKFEELYGNPDDPNHVVYLTQPQKEAIEAWHRSGSHGTVGIKMKPMQTQYNRRYGRGFTDVLGGIGNFLQGMLPGLMNLGIGAIGAKYGPNAGGLAGILGPSVLESLGGAGLHRRRHYRRRVRPHHYCGTGIRYWM